MALIDDLTSMMGSARLVELSNFDDNTATTTNTTRRNLALSSAKGAIRRWAGLEEPSDTTLTSYDTYRELAYLGFEYYLLHFRSRGGAETVAARDAFKQACEETKKAGWVPWVTDSVVDMTGQDDVGRPPRMSPSHFTGMRIRSLGGAAADTDLNEDL